MIQYYISAPDGTRNGPIDETSLRNAYYNGQYPSNTYVWAEGMVSWLTIDQVFGAIPPVPSPLPPQAAPPVQPPASPAPASNTPIPQAFARSVNKLEGRQLTIGGRAVPVGSVLEVNYTTFAMESDNQTAAFIVAAVAFFIVLAIIISNDLPEKSAITAVVAAIGGYKIVRGAGSRSTDTLSVSCRTKSGNPLILSVVAETGSNDAIRMRQFSEQIKQASGVK